MELELQYTELSCCEAGESVTLTQEETLEAAIPEYCPEVTRIVDAVGQLCLREYTSRQISGSVLVTVLYTSEESPGLRSLTLPVPFLTQADDKRLTGCDTVCMAGRLLLTEARAVTGRKLYLRVMPELTLTGYTCRRHRICTGVGEEPTLRLHRQEQSLTLLTSVTQRQSSVTQELQPQDWGEPPEELLAQRICPRITGSQPVGSRLLAKGEARICLLYRTQDGSLHTWEDTLPFSCLLDGLTVPEEAQVTVTGSCGTARLIRSDGAAAIGVELTLSLLVRTYETVTVAPVTDLYSTRWDTALQRQSLTLTETWPPETVQPEVHQELESRPFLYVTAADCGAVTTGQEGDHTTLRTPLRLRLLYLDESGAPVTAERTDEAAAPVPGDVTTARAACLSPSLRPSGTGLELTVPVELTVERSRRCTWDAITAAELTEPEPGRPLWCCAGRRKGRACGSWPSATARMSRPSAPPTDWSRRLRCRRGCC
jgi:hypothetical protein